MLSAAKKVGCLFRHDGNSYQRRTRRSKGVQNAESAVSMMSMGEMYESVKDMSCKTRWWFKICILFTPIGLKPPTRKSAEIYS